MSANVSVETLEKMLAFEDAMLCEIDRPDHICTAVVTHVIGKRCIPNGELLVCANFAAIHEVYLAGAWVRTNHDACGALVVNCDWMRVA